MPTLLENTRAAGLGGECQAEVKSAPLMIRDPEVSDIPRRDFNLTSASVRVRVRKLITRRGTRRVKHLKFTLQTSNDLEDTDGRR